MQQAAVSASEPERAPLPWFVLRPDRYRAEMERLRRYYPDFAVSERDLRAGILAVAGTLFVDHDGTRTPWPVLLLYPEDTPARPPILLPLTEALSGDDWSANGVRGLVRRLPVEYRRHQMPDGSLCVIEADAYAHEEWIHGDDVLYRAERIFSAVTLTRPVPFRDTEEADLTAYFQVVGHIVLGEEFYRTDLAGAGNWLAVPMQPDQRATGTAVGVALREHPLLWVGVRVATTQVNGFIEQSWEDMRDPVVRNAFPWVIEAPEGASITRPVLGRWYDVPEEPPPFKTGGELALLLEKAGVADPRGVIGTLGPARMGERFIALRYPHREGAGREWLFVHLHTEEEPPRDTPEAEREGIWREIMADAQVVILRTHPLVRANLELRSGPNASTLHGRRVAVFGCGALGGDVAVTLAKAGVGTLLLVDDDAMHVGNVVRHVAGLWSAGQSKVSAVKEMIHQHNPFVQVEVFTQSAGVQPAELDALLRQCDLVVSTIANENAEMVVNEAAVWVGRTVVYGRALRAGSAARVFRVRPGRDACKQCVALHRLDAERGMPHASSGGAWIDLPGVDDEILGHECGNPILAGSAVDLRFAADLTARAALDELGEGSAWNTLVWTRDPLPEVADDLARPYSTALRSVEPHPHCPTCGRPGVKEIVICSSARKAMYAQVEASPQAETGGILIGYRSTSGAAVVLEATPAGTAATETPFLFERDAEFVQARLNEAAVRLGVRGQYLGEWHSHLEARPRPSARDVKSLTGIAAAPGYLTNEPIMLIAGRDPSSGRVEHVHASCFPLGMRMHEQEWREVPDAEALALEPLHLAVG